MKSKIHDYLNLKNSFMSKKKLLITVATLICGGLLFTSCKKKEHEDNDTEGAKDHAMGETCSNDVTNIGSQASYANISTYRQGAPDQIYAGCATIKFDTLINTDNDTIRVDFGTGCTGLDSRTRKGILQFIYTAGKHYRDSGNVINVTTPGNTYYVNSNQVIINSKTITNKGHVTGGRLTWTVAADITINKSTGGTIHWTTNKTKVLLAGEQPNNLPINWAAAQVAIYGDASGTNAKGETFTAHVSQATWLVRDFSCSSFRRFFVKGVLEFTPGSKPTRYINFGTGNCDDQAVVTINGHTYNITLH